MVTVGAKKTTTRWVECDECWGSGRIEQEPDEDHRSTWACRCVVCDGRGSYPVCGQCNEPPDGLGQLEATDLDLFALDCADHGGVCAGCRNDAAQDAERAREAIHAAAE